MRVQNGWHDLKNDKPTEDKYLVWLVGDQGQIGVPPIRIASFNHGSWRLLPSDMGISDVTAVVSNWHDLPVIPPK